MAERVGHQIQMNLSVYPALVEQIENLAERYDWSKRQVVTLAVRALAQLMTAHERFAAEYDDDIGELYMRLAAELPDGFVEVPKDGVRVGRAADMPTVVIDNAWAFFLDSKTGNLLAEEQGGQKRIAVVTDGAIRPLKLPSAGEVALN